MKTLKFGNLLDNDSLSADGNNRLQLKGVNGGASHGQVISHESGYFRYLPQANYYGPDEFVYILCDRNNDCVEAVVSLQVHSVNDLPISEDDVFTFNEDESLLSAVSTNDNPSGDGGNRWNLNGLNGGAAHGTVTMDLQGSIQYTPKENYYGADLFTYTLCDINNDCVSARVYIQINPINDLPVSYDDVVSLQQAQIYFGDVSGNDLMSGDGGNEWLLELNRGLAQHGTVTFNGDGHYTYSPDPNYYGTDEFTYKLCDVDGDCSEARVSLNIAQIVGTGQTEGLQELLVSPNPVYENAQLTLKGFSGPVSCSIYNAMGIQLFDSGLLNAHELFNLNIDASSFQAGIYLVELKGEHLHLVRKIVKH
ncbi:MAG: tandem-95 repeat protein [Saprospiraceae bacterium]|nr:tandem-95 repeat protein [Saprospiraceae bacterium]